MLGCAIGCSPITRARRLRFLVLPTTRTPQKPPAPCYSVYTHRPEPHIHTATYFQPVYSAWTRTSPDTGDTVLMLAIEGFESVLEAREFLSLLVSPLVADTLQERLH